MVPKTASLTLKLRAERSRCKHSMSCGQSETEYIQDDLQNNEKACVHHNEENDGCSFSLGIPS